MDEEPEEIDAAEAHGDDADGQLDVAERMLGDEIGRRIARAQGTSLLTSAAVGALLLVAADLIAQHAFGDIQLPVGVITVSIGGIYLIWLLIQEARKAS